MAHYQHVWPFGPWAPGTAESTETTEAQSRGKQHSVLAEYNIDTSHVVEFTSASDPNTVHATISRNIDGDDKIMGVVSWKRNPEQSVGTHGLRAMYNVAAAKVYEFTPASDQNVICTYVENFHSGALTCSPISARPTP